MSKVGLPLTLGILIGFNIGLLVVVINRSFTELRCNNNNPTVRLNERIIGGRRIELQNFPFIAAIVVIKHVRLPKDTLQCGCCIISKKWVMSAAHCVLLLNEVEIEMKYIVIASNNAEWKKGKKHQVEKIIYNKNYNPELTKANDSSLFKVKTPFDAKNEKPILIAGASFKYKENSTAIVFGWGFNETKRRISQDRLLGVNVTIFDQEYCKDAYGEEITPDMFCAGDYEGGKDACQFDSGGPIVANNVLIGIVSWGEECGDMRAPGVYARVSAFHSWFKEIESTEKEKIGFTVKR